MFSHDEFVVVLGDCCCCSGALLVPHEDEGGKDEGILLVGEKLFGTNKLLLLLLPFFLFSSITASHQSSVPLTVLTLKPNEINSCFNDNGCLDEFVVWRESPIPSTIKSCFRT